MKLLYAAIASFAALVTPVHSASAGNCTEQRGCFSWSVEVMDTSAVQCSNLTGGCVVEVCLHLNTSLSTCTKDAGTFSHACDASDDYGCAYNHEDDTNPIFDWGPYLDNCPSVIGQGGGVIGTDIFYDAENNTAGTSKCNEAATTTFCQESEPGKTVYFILKDASSTADETNFTVVEFDPLPIDGNPDTACNPLVQCSNNLFSCGGNQKQLEMERVWAYTIPSAECLGCPETAVPEISPNASPNAKPPTLAPVAPPSGTQGDPHFKTWQNEHFEYHGQCDLVLVKDENFADGLGLDVQIRTKLIRFWSYIKQAAIRIGDDILEIEGSADPDADASYWVNFEYQRKLESLGGFPVTYYRKGTLGKWIYEIDLSSKFPNHKIVISTYKEFVRVDFVNPSAEAFEHSKGMLGDFRSGATLARDGFTILDDFTELGNEWQVLPVDNMLFHDTAEPQFPRKCIEPEDPRGERRRRLGESTVSEKQAEAACASIKDPMDRKDCIYDVISTQDLDMVGAY